MLFKLSTKLKLFEAVTCLPCCILSDTLCESYNTVRYPCSYSQSMTIISVIHLSSVSHPIKIVSLKECIWDNFCEYFFLLQLETGNLENTTTLPIPGYSQNFVRPLLLCSLLYVGCGVRLYNFCFWLGYHTWKVSEIC